MNNVKHIFSIEASSKKVKHALLLFSLLFAVILPAYSQEQRDSAIYVSSPMPSNARIHTFVIFVSTPNGMWDRISSASMMTKFYEAEQWIRSEAARYGHTITFVNTVLGGKGDIVQVALPSLTTSYQFEKRFANQIFSKHECGGLDNIPEWVTKEKNCQRSLILYVINGVGNCFSSVFDNASSPNVQESCANMSFFYRWSGPFQTLMPGMCAHEMLHQLGAWDLYETQSLSVERANLAKSKYADSIMISVEDLPSRQIDEVTAWLIGIAPGKEEFLIFKPNNN